ncbi:unnamed protein product [Coffea canephora]|uniref:Coenzyme Q-binding protein COQ10 START domain-containing protein n=1 Tax=Coffea canephora TaxID=49390 RepID=A0A068URW3_COFCA|nr:unnamed protein product [Coffea canephora]
MGSNPVYKRSVWDSVWDALTDYEQLADFIPNLVGIRRIPCPHPGCIWLEQKGLQRAVYWHVEAWVVLDLQEFQNSANDCELQFFMVDGDFKKFEGKWSVKSGKRSSKTTLIKATLSPNWAVFGKVCKLYNPCMVDEVHLRRFDGLLLSNPSFGLLVKENGGVHRCVIASITVKAPVCEVWNILTEYGRFPEKVLYFGSNINKTFSLFPFNWCRMVPNLAISKILSREYNKVRNLQVKTSGLLYMVLHARVVLYSCEVLEQDSSFDQVEGDFDSFRGKYNLVCKDYRIEIKGLEF